MLPTKTIKIGENTYHVKLTFRALIEFEKATGHAIGFETTEDALMLFYCAIKAGASAKRVAYPVTFEELLNEIDDHPEALAAIYAVLTEEASEKKK